MSSSSITTFNKQFEQASKEFEVHWEMGREAAKSADQLINEMISILHRQYPDWSYTKIAKEIWIKHEHLEGFTLKTIRAKLDETNIKLLPPPKPKTEPPKPKTDVIIEHSSGTKLSHQRDNKVIEQSSTDKGKQHYQPNSALKDFREEKGRTKLDNNVMDDDDDTCHHTVPEESSRTNVGEAVDDVYSLEDEGEEPNVKYDDPEKLIKQYEQQIEDLTRDYERVIVPYEVIETVEIDGKEYTHIIHVDPYKRQAWTEPDLHQQQKRTTKK